jgi:hypothetical protein
MATLRRPILGEAAGRHLIVSCTLLQVSIEKARKASPQSLHENLYAFRLEHRGLP